MPDTFSRRGEDKDRREDQTRASDRSERSGAPPEAPKLSPEKRKRLLEDAERHIEANREVYEGLARE